MIRLPTSSTSSAILKMLVLLPKAVRSGSLSSRQLVQMSRSKFSSIKQFRTWMQLKTYIAMHTSWQCQIRSCHRTAAHCLISVAISCIGGNKVQASQSMQQMLPRWSSEDNIAFNVASAWGVHATNNRFMTGHEISGCQIDWKRNRCILTSCISGIKNT